MNVIKNRNSDYG